MNVWPFILSILMVSSGNSNAQHNGWQKVDDGLFIGEFDAPQKSPIGDSKITVLKIDPAYYALKLLCASDYDSVARTAKQWCQKHSLVAAVNAGMFHADGLTHVGYTRNFSTIHSPRFVKDYKAVLAFNRVDASVPEIQIIDLECQDFEELKDKYQTLVQNIRMISCTQSNVWSPQPRQWSMVVLCMDRSGNVLFVFTRSPYSVHDFINMLLSLPLSIYKGMYLEGGPEAALYVSAGGMELEKMGSYETGFWEYDGNWISWPVPNVIGVVRKSLEEE